MKMLLLAVVLCAAPFAGDNETAARLVRSMRETENTVVLLDL